jgi:hypothetical protein
MSDLDALLGAPQPPKMYCQFGRWFSTLDAADQNTIKKFFGDAETTTSHIARTLIEHRACPVSESSIRSHRRGECRTCGTMK